MNDAARPPADRRLGVEVVLVLAVTLGQSAVYSVLALVRDLLQPEGLARRTTSLNPARASEPFFDATYRLLDIGFDLALVGLVLYLLGARARHRIGLDGSRPGRDVARALLLLVVIGVPGLALYVAARVAGLAVQVQPAPLDQAAWTIPLLVLSAARAGLLEEVILNGYLPERLGRLGWSPWLAVVVAAVLRAAYHAYQGAAGIVGNFLMGLVFGWCRRRWGRVMPLVLAHTFIDVIAFVGYPLAAPYLP